MLPRDDASLSSLGALVRTGGVGLSYTVRQKSAR
jgi:hypothetical protein